MPLWYLRGYTSDLSGGDDFDLAMAPTPSTTSTTDVNLAALEVRTSHHYSDSFYPMWNNAWESGTWTIDWILTAGDTKGELSFIFRRISSTGTILESQTVEGPVTCAAGALSLTTASFSWSAGDYDDRIRVDWIHEDTHAHSAVLLTHEWNVDSPSPGCVLTVPMANNPPVTAGSPYLAELVARQSRYPRVRR
jgi:hypothetical protein